jgi:hypothetical protein
VKKEIDRKVNLLLVKSLTKWQGKRKTINERVSPINSVFGQKVTIKIKKNATLYQNIFETRKSNIQGMKKVNANINKMIIAKTIKKITTPILYLLFDFTSLLTDCILLILFTIFFNAI